LYVEELIAADTVNTMPPQTLAAFRDHGRPRTSLTEDLEGARDTMRTLAEAGISLKDTTDALLADGIQLFAKAFRALLAAVEQQRRPAD
jgi:transaldolase/glucose-6-phosphate isomerase